MNRASFLLSVPGLRAVLATSDADDPWSKVRNLKSGAEIRVFKRDSRQPIHAKVDEATDDKLIVVVRDEQMSISKDEIDRIDARPAPTKSRLSAESRTSVSDPERKPSSPGPGNAPAVPSTRSSSTLSLGGKPDFETVYRRSSGVPRQAR